MLGKCWVAGALIVACASAGSAQNATASAQTLDQGIFFTLLRPVRDAGTEVSGIAVRSIIHTATIADGKRFGLSAPIVYAGVPGIADRVRDLVVADAQGIVPMTASDEAATPGGFPYYRHWTADRAIRFPVTITYRSLVEPIGSKSGPPFGIRAQSGGVAGAGAGFLVLPENVALTRSRVRWDISGLESGSTGITSFGEGSFELAGSPDQLRDGWYLAGPAGHYPATGDVAGFSAAWLGVPPWDPQVEMAQAGRVHAYLTRFFQVTKPPRFRVFARILDTPPFGGGTALTNSFMLSRGPARPGEGKGDLQGLLFHEMIHGFVGSIDGPQGVISWYTEGLTSYYTTRLQLLGGFESVADYLADVNRVTARYLASPARTWTPERIVQTGFGDEAVRSTPYVRGELYFADLDARIRAHSNGKRNLDMVMLDLFARRAAGAKFDFAVWRETVTREAGPEAAALFDAVILKGETIVPAADAFGPCLTRAPDGAQPGGHRWTRVASVPDARCARP